MRNLVLLAIRVGVLHSSEAAHIGFTSQKVYLTCLLLCEHRCSQVFSWLG